MKDGAKYQWLLNKLIHELEQLDPFLDDLAKNGKKTKGKFTQKKITDSKRWLLQLKNL